MLGIDRLVGAAAAGWSARTGRYKMLPVVGLAAATVAFLGLGWGAMAG
jgi:hypothetical protein